MTVPNDRCTGCGVRRWACDHYKAFVHKHCCPDCHHVSDAEYAIHENNQKQSEINTLVETLGDVLNQACAVNGGRDSTIDTACISAYTNAAGLLCAHGVLERLEGSNGRLYRWK